MSTRAIRRNMMKHQKPESKCYTDFVCAAFITRKLFITSSMAYRVMQGNKNALRLLNQYKESYPDFQVTVNDEFFLNTFGYIPT